MPASVAEEHRHAIGRVGRALAARHAAIGRAIAARVADEIPEYRRAADDVLADLRDGATATAGVLARTLADGTDVRREDVVFVRELAARRVRQGVTLDVFLHAYRTALSAYWDACADEAARQDLSREAGVVLARVSMDAMDAITTQAAEGYLREEHRLHTLSGRAERDLVERLVRGEPVAAGTRDPAAPGIDPTAELFTVIARVASSALSGGDALQVAREALSDGAALGRTRPLVVIRESEVVLVAPARPHADALRRARDAALAARGVDIRIGIGAACAGFAGVAQAHREASLALSYTSASRPMIALSDLSPLECALVGADAGARALIAAKGARLRALGDAERTSAIATVRAFAHADLNVNRAARALGIHPNTVRYRLERIATATGHDPRTFPGLVDLVCILETLTPGLHPARDEGERPVPRPR